MTHTPADNSGTGDSNWDVLFLNPNGDIYSECFPATCLCQETAHICSRNQTHTPPIQICDCRLDMNSKGMER